MNIFKSIKKRIDIEIQSRKEYKIYMEEKEKERIEKQKELYRKQIEEIKALPKIINEPITTKILKELQILSTKIDVAITTEKQKKNTTRYATEIFEINNDSPIDIKNKINNWIYNTSDKNKGLKDFEIISVIPTQGIVNVGDDNIEKYKSKECILVFYKYTV